MEILGNECYYAIIPKKVQGERFKRLAIELVFAQLDKTLQMIKYSECEMRGRDTRDSIQEIKKLFFGIKNENTFLTNVNDTQLNLNKIRDSYISGHGLRATLQSFIVNSNKSPKHVEQLKSPKKEESSLDPSIDVKKSNLPTITTFIQNDYILRYTEADEGFQIEYSKKMEDDLLKEIQQLQARIFNEENCIESITKTYYSDCEFYKQKFEKKNQEYEQDIDVLDNEILSKKLLLQKLQDQRKFMTNEIIRFHAEIEKMKNKSAKLEVIPQPPAHNVTIVTALLKKERKKPKKPKEPELIKFKEVKSLNLQSKFENMKNLEKKKFRVKVKQTIKGKQIKKALKMEV